MNKPVFICSPNSDWSVTGTTYTTSKETCSAMLAMLMHAKSTNAQVGPLYFDGEAVPAQCNSWEGWKGANVRYFMY